MIALRSLQPLALGAGAVYAGQRLQAENVGG